MSRDLRFKLLWALWMGLGGVATAAVVYVLTDSFGWAVVALVASGPVLNMIAQIVIQPIKAATGRRSPDDARAHRDDPANSRRGSPGSRALPRSIDERVDKAPSSIAKHAVHHRDSGVRAR